MSSRDLEHLVFELRGIKLHAVAAGPADGPVVILLHGFPEFWKSWSRQIPPLARAGYRVIVPDQRGYNRSDKPPKIADYRLELLAEDVICILDHLGVRQAFIAGHDFGATVTWWLLTFHPERFKAAVILNVPHPLVMQRRLRTSFGQMRKSCHMFFFQLPVVPERWFARNDCSAGLRLLVTTSRSGTFSREDLADYKRAWSVPGALRPMINWYRAAFRFALPRRTPAQWRVSVPVLVLWGEQDVFLSTEMARESLDFCADGICVLLPGVSHWIPHEEPARVTEELIRQFSAPGNDLRASC